MASWTIPRATCIRCRFKWATSHGGRPHHHVAKCHDVNANSNVAILHHTMAATQSPSQASENQDTIALDRKVYLMGYALCRRPPIIAHCFRIADSLHCCKRVLVFLGRRPVIWYDWWLHFGVLGDPGPILGHWGA